MDMMLKGSFRLVTEFKKTLCCDGINLLADTWRCKRACRVYM